MNSNQTIILNVRDFKYEVLVESLMNHPSTRLGKLMIQKENQNLAEISRLCPRFNSDLNEFYFDRDPFVLNMILNYYITNKHHLNQSDCAIFLKDELDYWQIDDQRFYTCCQVVYHDKIEDSDEILKLEIAALKKINEKENFGDHFFPKQR